MSRASQERWSRRADRILLRSVLFWSRERRAEALAAYDRVWSDAAPAEDRHDLAAALGGAWGAVAALSAAANLAIQAAFDLGDSGLATWVLALSLSLPGAHFFCHAIAPRLGGRVAAFFRRDAGVYLAYVVGSVVLATVFSA